MYSFCPLASVSVTASLSTHHDTSLTMLTTSRHAMVLRTSASAAFAAAGAVLTVVVVVVVGGALVVVTSMARPCTVTPMDVGRHAADTVASGDGDDLLLASYHVEASRCQRMLMSESIM